MRDAHSWSPALGRVLVRQLSKEGSRIHHEADGLEAAAVAEFGRNGRVDIHAHGGNFRGQAVPGGDGVQRRRDQYREPDSREGGAHGRLGVSRVRDDVGQWPVVADASRQHHVDVFVDARGDDPVPDQPGFHRAL